MFSLYSDYKHPLIADSVKYGDSVCNCHGNRNKIHVTGSYRCSGHRGSIVSGVTFEFQISNANNLGVSLN